MLLYLCLSQLLLQSAQFADAARLAEALIIQSAYRSRGRLLRVGSVVCLELFLGGEPRERFANKSMKNVEGQAVQLMVQRHSSSR